MREVEVRLDRLEELMAKAERKGEEVFYYRWLAFHVGYAKYLIEGMRARGIEKVGVIYPLDAEEGDDDVEW